MNDLDKRAALAMGWTEMPHGRWLEPGGTFTVGRSPYSTDMNATMELDEYAFKCGWQLRVRRAGKYWVASYCHPAFNEYSAPCSSEVEATARTKAFLELYESGKLGEKK